MKGLSVEEKAKAYDEALKVAHEYWDSPRTCIDIDVLPKLFPELKEPDEEMIRKALIHYMKDYSDGTGLIHTAYGVRRNDAIAWLEKQGEITKEWSEMKFNNIQTELQEMVDLKQKTEQGEQNPYASETYEEALAKLKKQRPSGCPEYCVMSTCSNCPNQPIVVKQKPADELLKIANKQEPTGWSEEDEKMVGNIRSIIEKYAFSQSAVDVNGDLCEKEYIDADN